MEAPAGLVKISYKQEGKKVKSVKLANVPAYLAAENLTAECPDLGPLTFDVSYGGNFYAIVDPQENFGGLENYSADQLIAWSRVLRKRINEKYTFVHTGKSHHQRLARIFYGQAKHCRKMQRPAMPFFMAIKLSTVRLAAPVLLGTHGARWHAKGKLKKA